jgi:hypothetical protein
VLGKGVPQSWLSRSALRFFNAHQTLNNLEDDYASLVQALHAHLDDVQIELVGSVALFSGRA